MWVIDGSFMPRSAAVNPSLTIAANALFAAEQLAGEQDLARVELPLVEAALDQGREAMEKFIAEQEVESAAPEAKPETEPARPAAPAGKCPWHDAATDVVRKPQAVDAARDGVYLNEVGLMSTLNAKRKD